MFKFVVLAALVALVSANGYGYGHAPAHAVLSSVAVSKTVAVPTVVGYGEKTVGSKVVGYNTHQNVHYVPKEITQAHHILKPATWQQSSGSSHPGSGVVISHPIKTHSYGYAHGPALALGHGGY